MQSGRQGDASPIRSFQQFCRSTNSVLSSILCRIEDLFWYLIAIYVMVILRELTFVAVLGFLKPLFRVMKVKLGKNVIWLFLKMPL